MKPSSVPSSPTLNGSNDDLIFGREVGVRIVTFNRPAVLNALNLNMIRQLTPWLHRVEPSDTAQVVVFHGASPLPANPTKTSSSNKVSKAVSPAAFCAGGDIRFLYEMAKDGQDDDEKLKSAFDFFREEYRLNYLLSECKTPIVSFLNGITMGGGVGLSMHGKFVVATHSTVFAMPETAIGFFPDVGGSYFLPRLGQLDPDFPEFKNEKEIGNKGQGLGTYLALTGERVKGAEVSALGMATHFIDEDSFDTLTMALTALSSDPKYTTQDIKDELVCEILTGLEMQDTTEALNSEFYSTMESIFGAECENDTVEGILDRLKSINTPWSLEMKKKLLTLSPLSLKVTHRQMREGAKLNMKKCLEMEFRIACRMMSNVDFIEGVRAMIVDKTFDAKWKHSSIEQVTTEEVDFFFQPFENPDDELLLYSFDQGK